MVLQLVVCHPEEKKVLRQFLRLTPPKFIGTPGEDTYELLTNCEDRLCNLGLVKFHKVEFVTY